MDKTGKRRYLYFYLPWTKREREDIDTFTYHGKNGQEKTYILLLTMDKTVKRRYLDFYLTMEKTGKRIHRYFYLPWTKMEREDIYTFTYNGQNGQEKTYILLSCTVYLLYKYVIRINFCFFRTIRINFSAYE